MVFVTKNGKVIAIIADILDSWIKKKNFFIYLFSRQRCFKTGSGSFEL